jgi:hypothetical protein
MCSACAIGVEKERGGEVGEGGENDVGTRGKELVVFVCGCHADGEHSGGLGGEDAGGCVFDHCAVCGCQAEELTGAEEDVGRGFAAGDLGAVDDGGEVWADAAGVENEVDVFRWSG